MKPSPILYCTLAVFISALPASAQETAPASESSANVQVLAGPLSLEESIRIALRTQGGPGAAQLQASSAQESIKSARAGYAPQVTGRVGYDYLNSNSVIVLPDSNGVPGGIISGGGSGGTTSTDIAISQNLFDSGRTRQRVRSAQARSQSAVGSFGSARSSLAFQVAQAFYEQLRQEKLTQQFAGQVALAEQQVQQVRAQIEEGTVARVDILSVQVALRQARFDQVTAQKNLAVARVNFRNVLGLGRGPALELEQSPRVTAIAGTSEVPAPPAPLTPDEIEAGTSVPGIGRIACGDGNSANRAARSAAIGDVGRISRTSAQPAPRFGAKPRRRAAKRKFGRSGAHRTKAAGDSECRFQSRSALDQRPSFSAWCGFERANFRWRRAPRR